MNIDVLKKVAHSATRLVFLMMLGSLFTPVKADEVLVEPLATPDPGITVNTMVVIPNHARYIVTGAVTGTDLSAPFGSLQGCPLNKSVKTIWPLNSTIELRKEFLLRSGAHNLRVQLSIDNNANIFINTTPLAPVAHAGCPLVDEILIPAPDSALNPGGVNVIRVVATDTGFADFVDLRVLVDVP